MTFESDLQVRRNGYVYCKDILGILGKPGARVLEHRLIAAMKYGPSALKGHVVRHRNNKTMDNNPDNIIICNKTKFDAMPKRPITYTESIILSKRIKLMRESGDMGSPI